jgi:phage terminase large subunit-like protein
MTVASEHSSTANKYVDENGRTDAETYLMGVLDGTIVAGQKLVKLAEKMLPRIRNGYKKWHYSVRHATRAVEFIEKFCKIPSGTIGVPFILEPYERLIVELTFGFVDDDGVRQIRYTLILWARKNGKTSLAAAMELYMLVADGEGAPQIYNLATSKSQASLGFGAVSKMVRQSPALKKVIRRGKVIERNEVGLVCDNNMGYIISLSKQPDHLDGLDVHCVVVDEMAAMKDRSLYDLLRQGMGARRQSLVIAITTEGRVRDNLWDSEHAYAEQWLDDKLEEEDDHFLGILFEQDDKAELLEGLEQDFDVELGHVWMKSNPGLGTVKGFEYLRGEVIKAKNDPSYLPTVLTKEFNIRANAATAFLSYEEAYNEQTYDFSEMGFEYGIVGFDAADTIDLNAATVLCMRPGDDHIYRRSMYWIAQEQMKVNTNSMRGRDGVPYELWEREGYLRVVPGNKVDRRVFLEWIDELYDEGIFIVGASHDRYGMKEIEAELEARVGKRNVIPVAFGAITLSVPMKQLKADMRDGRIIDNNNPIDHWCNANVTIKEDVNGNIQPIKIAGPTSRIDGFAALICAYKHLVMDRWDDYQAIISE